jgi:hypothetical protein
MRGKDYRNSSNSESYTKTQRKEIIAFASKMKGKNGRGGVAAAAKRFGVAASVVEEWINEDAALHSTDQNPRRNPATSRILARLMEIRKGIDSLERELARERARFNQLKGSGKNNSSHLIIRKS